MPVIFLHSGPQDPSFGLSLDNIDERLTRRNWNSKAIVRLSDDGPLYVWITRAERGFVRGPRICFYRVCVDGVEKRQKDLERDFAYLKDALSYANGEDDGELGKQTRRGSRDDWPPEVTKEPHWTVFFPSQMFRS